MRDWSKRSVAGADKKLHPKKVSPLPLRTPDRTGPPVRQPPIGAPRLPRTSQPNLGYTLFLPTNPFARRNTENCSETNSTYPPPPPPPPPPFLSGASLFPGSSDSSGCRFSRDDTRRLIKAFARMASTSDRGKSRVMPSNISIGFQMFLQFFYRHRKKLEI